MNDIENFIRGIAVNRYKVRDAQMSHEIIKRQQVYAIIKIVISL